ncbi:putative ubiquitin-conjugating enzyme E2 23 [Zea mays]|uniref:Putative ubiquitin-conjugating enzyme E2 25 n=2 Tax=Zea mays TaxID=4577 RepID=A0A1D6GYT0_MAIZE|nr:probable ubiquitin-conjugating enzyme E2 25 [Zea mays]AQK67914.1 putative ubiquitin-conjugating enzyme E2 25 [Zea mays]PWZ23812.1 putative ubiquitin-conjugating enzyme E2 23 [Zea mays]|eukprot:XP_020393268.1 probable ubiquitin-conjugating enzyme E2 25 [Zea mays]
MSCVQKVYYHSGGLRLNPNLYESGKVCLSLLNTWWGKGCEKWGKSSSTMLQVLVSIQGLVLNDRPYFNEPGYKNSAETTGGERCSLAYNQTTFVRSCKTTLYSLRKPPMHFETLVLWHFHEHERAILDACRAYMSGTVVGSSAGTGSNRRYVHDKCFAEFHKSLTLYTEHLRAEFATNRRRVMELETEDEIVPSIAASMKSC